LLQVTSLLITSYYPTLYRTGKHLLLSNCTITSSDTTRPTLPNIALNAL